MQLVDTSEDEGTVDIRCFTAVSGSYHEIWILALI